MTPAPRHSEETSKATPGSGSPAVLYLVATPIGNLEDITYRAVRVLKEVAAIAAEDTRHTGKLLHRYSIRTRALSLHEHNERRQVPRVIRMLEQGDSVALVTDAGTPLLSDPGGHLVREALARGIVVQAVPGPSAILAALIVSGLAKDQFTFVGFPPNRSKARQKWLDLLANDQRPLVVFEAPHRIIKCLEDMKQILGDREIAVCREMTKMHEELVKGPISKVLGQLKRPRGEFTIVVSPPLSKVSLVDPDHLADQLDQITKIARSRRDGVRELARKYGLSTRRVYEAIESTKIK